MDRWRGDGKLVLVLDEFQWIAGASPELPSILQECWDRHWRDSGRVVLILCGSFVGVMERTVLGKGSPLFGRRTAQIFLKPFSYREAARFHPGWSSADHARAYFVCGGVPLYLRMFDAARSIEKNIEHALLDELAPLFREPDFLLREELRDVESYYAVLRAIASGHVTARAIAANAALPERSLHYYLQQLSELGYVRRRHPLTGARPAARIVRYTLEDPLLRFWFRFVFPNTSFLQQMGARRALAERIRPELDAYWGSCFERLCREALGSVYEREGVSAAFEVGEYWDKETQIDLVSVRDDGWIDLGECKWGAVKSLPALARELEAKGGQVPEPPQRHRRASLLPPPPAQGRAPGGAERFLALARRSLCVRADARRGGRAFTERAARTRPPARCRSGSRAGHRRPRGSCAAPSGDRPSGNHLARSARRSAARDADRRPSDRRPAARARIVPPRSGRPRGSGPCNRDRRSRPPGCRASSTCLRADRCRGRGRRPPRCRPRGARAEPRAGDLELVGAHAFDANDAWALGGNNVWHYDGAAWTEEPIDFLVFCGWETAPDGTLFAVGRGGDVVSRRP